MNDDLIVPVGSVEPVPRLALLGRELAPSFGISQRTLTTWEAEGIGPPSVKINRIRLYPIDEVRIWLADQASGNGQGGEDDLLDGGSFGDAYDHDPGADGDQLDDRGADEDLGDGDHDVDGQVQSDPDHDGDHDQQNGERPRLRKSPKWREILGLLDNIRSEAACGILANRCSRSNGDMTLAWISRLSQKHKGMLKRAVRLTRDSVNRMADELDRELGDVEEHSETA